jgi:hypothetical protein
VVTATSASIGPISGQIQSVYNFWDAAQFWLRQPLSERDRRYLKAHAGSMLLAHDLGITEPAWWDWSYRQVIRLCQPDDDAIRYLAERKDVLLNYLELAHDLIFTNEEAAQELLRLTPKHFVQRWHRTRAACTFENGNYKTGLADKPGMVFQAYADQYSKKTGEFDCYRIEAQITGAAILRRMGIGHPKDLLGFNLTTFWDRNLVYLDVDRETFGRCRINRVNKTKKRAKAVNGYDVNRATGNLLCRVFGNGSAW